MTNLKLSRKTLTGAVVKAMPDFEQLMRRERQFNLLRTINEMSGAKKIPWLTICRIAGLTEIEISLLNDRLEETARGTRGAA